ncbi:MULTISPECIES: YwqG family protein [unclassified Crossiella]|uniref:YwqG family protein n=1 Tax=unclassified Crossiella TaxID=2620835 RepID=UPI001FFE4379|nr:MULTISPECIES: YwqG family protein [unclassified Crossiella]MCK2243452.1 YwqG family protein [Crossiella sp. S99.2]MCK2257310.1 YwqG family protein [Crossiella sp. S99.1]
MTSPQELRTALAELARERVGDDLGDRLVELSRPSIRLLHAESGIGRSRLGGDPVLPPGTDWPAVRGEPLSLVAVLDLAEVAEFAQVDWLPKTGLLNFFYDLVGVWAYTPDAADSFHVAYLPDGGVPVSAPVGATVFPARPVRFAHLLTLPSQDDEVLELSKAEARRLGKLSQEWARRTARLGGWSAEAPNHQINGWPDLIQGPVWLEAYYDSQGLEWARTPEGRAEHECLARAQCWRLLLQLDSDDAMDWMWGDVGTLYYNIPDQSARAGEFGRTWLIMQCS